MPPKASKPAASSSKKAAAGTKKSTTSKGAASSTPKAAAAKDAAAATTPSEEPKAAVLPGISITLKQLSVVMEDRDGKVKESGKWPMIIDTTSQASTYLRYQNSNYLNALNPTDMHSETIRLALIGSLRFGKPLVIDMMEADMFQTVSDTMDELLSGLLAMIMDKSILEEENYMKLVKEVDGDNYEEDKFSPMFLENFKLIFISQCLTPSEKLLKVTYPVRVEALK